MAEKVTITQVKCDSSWYEVEWTIVIARGSGPASTKLWASDLPEDIRQGLINWLEADRR
jgi:hypothetical protein